MPALSALLFVALTGALVATLGRHSEDPDARVTAERTATSVGPGTTPPDDDAAAYGPQLALNQLGPLPDGGVALAVDDVILFLGLDGSVYGHLAAGFSDPPPDGRLRSGPTNLLPVLSRPDGTWLWLDPSTGGVQDATVMGTPLWGGLRVLSDPDSSEMMVFESARQPMMALASWPESSPW